MRLGQPAPANRACGSPERPGQPWDGGVTQAEDTLLVMLSWPHSRDVGWIGQYGGRCFMFFVFFQLMLLKVLWFSVMLKTTLTEPDTLPLLDNHSKSRVSKRGKQNMLGWSMGIFMQYAPICRAHSAAQVRLHLKCFGSFSYNKNVETARVSVLSVARGGESASTAGGNCSYSSVNCCYD